MDTPGDVLKHLGLEGILTQPPDKGGAIYLLCEMDECYCPRGRGYFEPISRDDAGALVDWMPTEEHWPIGQAEGGHREAGNIWLAHRLCNGLAFGTEPGHEKRRQQARSRRDEWREAHRDEYLAQFGNRQAAEAQWREHSSRKAACSGEPHLYPGPPPREPLEGGC